jgi:hypothetical protein
MQATETEGLIQYIVVPVSSNGTLGYVLAGSRDTILMENSVRLFGDGWEPLSYFQGTDEEPITAIQMHSQGGLNHFEDDDLSDSLRQTMIDTAFSNSESHTSIIELMVYATCRLTYFEYSDWKQ